MLSANLNLCSNTSEYCIPILFSTVSSTSSLGYVVPSVATPAYLAHDRCTQSSSYVVPVSAYVTPVSNTGTLVYAVPVSSICSTGYLVPVTTQSSDYINSEKLLPVQESLYDKPMSVLENSHDETQGKSTVGTIVDSTPTLADYINSEKLLPVQESLYDKPMSVLENSHDETQGKSTVGTIVDSTSTLAVPLMAAFWATAVDPATGKTYYYNTCTNETTWDIPPSLCSAANSSLV